MVLGFFLKQNIGLFLFFASTFFTKIEKSGYSFFFRIVKHTQNNRKPSKKWRTFCNACRANYTCFSCILYAKTSNTLKEMNIPPPCDTLFFTVFYACSTFFSPTRCVFQHSDFYSNYNITENCNFSIWPIWILKNAFFHIFSQKSTNFGFENSPISNLRRPPLRKPLKEASISIISGPEQT